ncbi:hypothetical protein PoB_005380600 [Plakobranchus ocellatus]|uniref:Uncharacterized protein n=1 Tax=Plakobranchus ocellatus TaxID=259542 RepID=A0AAV4C7I4_9GAST|nr:hypothetical protein PoB_005380600 [Plakobranchus ocellatus]
MRVTAFLLLYLFVRMITAQRPSMTIITNSSSFSCSNEYLVAGEDSATFEVDLSGNNSDYTYDEFDWPRFRLQTKDENMDSVEDKGICAPFDSRDNGFCVNRVDPTGCSCEMADPQVYRVKLVYRIEIFNGSRGRLELLWPSIDAGDLSVFYYLPEIREEESTSPDPDPETSSSSSSSGLVVAIVAGIISLTIIIFLLASCLVHYCGCVHIRCYDPCRTKVLTPHTDGAGTAGVTAPPHNNSDNKGTPSIIITLIPASKDNATSGNETPPPSAANNAKQINISNDTSTPSATNNTTNASGCLTLQVSSSLQGSQLSIRSGNTSQLSGDNASLEGGRVRRTSQSGITIEVQHSQGSLNSSRKGSRVSISSGNSSLISIENASLDL